MSRVNRANRDRYMQAGRLTPDEMARERQKQTKAVVAPAPARVKNRAAEKSPPGRGGPASTRPRSAPEE